MARGTVTIEGLDRLRLRLHDVPADVADGARRAVRDGAEAVRDQVERTIRVDTGRARREVKVRHVGTGGLSADVGWFNPDMYYVKFLEHGTSSIAADPVLQTATEAERVRFAGRVSADVREALGI